MSCLKSAYGTKIFFSDLATNEALVVESVNTVPDGPYLAQISEREAILGPVYRIFQDDHMAFMNGILPNGTDGAFRSATVNTLSDSTIGIPVPSRLYTKGLATECRPFEGLRVGVKDIIDLKGVRTSNGNRAWFKLYEAKNASAPAMQKLHKMGALMIGKTKTAQFANSDRPTADWVDYQWVGHLSRCSDDR